jgi:hypothetical protein
VPRLVYHLNARRVSGDTGPGHCYGAARLSCGRDSCYCE